MTLKEHAFITLVCTILFLIGVLIGTDFGHKKTMRDIMNECNKINRILLLDNSEYVCISIKPLP